MKTTLITFLSLCAISASAGGWISLFDGKSLDGWTQKNGQATYKVEDGAIVGTTAKKSPNSFLCTDKDYGNFELTFEVRLINNELNSGVQIRSNTKGDKPDGRVNGPQVEIEATGPGDKGSESGYVYGEACGGWMTPKADLKSHKHFKNGQWNTYRIIANGATIQTWVNGEKVSNLTDKAKFESHPKGFIGLQVHGVGARGPFSVMWRNIKIREITP